MFDCVMRVCLYFKHEHVYNDYIMYDTLCLIVLCVFVCMLSMKLHHQVRPVDTAIPDKS